MHVANLMRPACVLLILAIITLVGRAELGSDHVSVIQASQILTEIENGRPVDLYYVVVEGDLDLSKLNLSKTKIIASPITIENSIIYGAVKFNDTAVQGPISFERTKFLGPANFFQVQFNGDADFSESQFNDTAIFRKAQFNGAANFRKAQFNGFADFYESLFKAEPINFEGSQFKGTAYFKWSQFAVNYVNFGWSQFNESAIFWHAESSGDVDFTGSQFSGTTDFTLAQFNGVVKLIGARFNKDIYINDFKFKSLKVNWESFRDKLVCNGPMYIELIKNFKDMEQFEDADSCYYEYRNWKRDNRPLGWLKVFDYISWLSCGYGVRWQYTIFLGIIMIAFFGVYFEFRYLTGAAAKILLKKNIQGQTPSISDLLRSIKESTSLSVMILLSLPSDWHPYGKEEYSKSVKSHLYAAILERLIGWGLMLLLIGTLTRLMVRY